MIESSTDTLVPEASEQGAVGERAQQAESPATAAAGNWTLGGSDIETNGANGSLPRPSLSQSHPLQQNRLALLDSISLRPLLHSFTLLSSQIT